MSIQNEASSLHACQTKKFFRVDAFRERWRSVHSGIGQEACSGKRMRGISVNAPREKLTASKVLFFVLNNNNHRYVT